MLPTLASAGRRIPDARAGALSGGAMIPVS
jgi:hypothetical protein